MEIAQLSKFDVWLQLYLAIVNKRFGWLYGRADSELNLCEAAGKNLFRRCRHLSKTRNFQVSAQFPNNFIVRLLARVIQ
jgi:hypothetical protein